MVPPQGHDAVFQLLPELFDAARADAARKGAPRARGMCAGKKCEVVESAFRISGQITRDLTYSWVGFEWGNGSASYSGTCRLMAFCEFRVFLSICRVNYFVVDKFADPFDIGWDPGTPYLMVARKSEEFIVSGSF